MIAMSLSACSPNRDAAVLHLLRAQLGDQYRACVPLGWDPVPIATTFIPGFSAEYRPPVEWLPPFWLGAIQNDELRDPSARVAFDLLNHLAKQSLVEKHVTPFGFRYNLTMAGLAFYLESSQYGNNVDHLPYLCYSRIVPTKIVWAQPIRQTYRAGFQWSAGDGAPWANDPFLRSHSVILAPTKSPAIAKIVRFGGSWEVVRLYAGSMLPQLSDAAVWPRGEMQPRARRAVR
ncbi:MAG TPA: hypothetical protein VGR69_06645 [Candidatus Rubrimentiphilum sp.]|nr:hypothetical protein [Candidatus Rubrimentiphilum sp.]